MLFIAVKWKWKNTLYVFMSVFCIGLYILKIYINIYKSGPYWRADWLLQSYWMLQEELWTEGGGRKEPGEYGLAGKIQFLWEETGNERAGKIH